MIAMWIPGITFIATALFVITVALVIHDWFFRYRFAVRGRLDELIEAKERDRENAALFKDLSRLRPQEIQSWETWRERLRNLIEESGLTWTEQTVANYGLAGALAGGVGGLWLFGWLGLSAVLVGLAAPLIVLYGARRKRRRQLCRQLPETFEMISRAVRAGQTVPAALQIIAEDFEPPVSKEFALCYEQQNLGVSRETALRRLARRTGVMELQIFVVALLVQARSGGDLVELLDNLADMARKRLKLGERIRALTGEGRMQATVLMILPTAALLALLMLAPEYAAALLERPWLIVGSAVMQGLGLAWIRRIVNFEI